MIFRYNFERDLNSDKPQILYFIKDDCFVEYDKNKSASHNVAEFYYITQGNGFLHAEDKIYPFTKGDVFVVNPYIVHGEFVEKNTPDQGFTYYILGISNFSFDNKINAITPKNLSQDNNIIKLLDMMLQEQIEKKDNYMQVFQSLFEVLLIEIRRTYNTDTIPSDFSQEVLAVRVKNYLDLNYLGDTSSKSIADVFGRKINTIEKKFKKQFGYSIQQYILHLRIEMAKNHLVFNNISVLDVAFFCGFSNSSYFSHYFKKVVGMTPTEYRKFMTEKIKDKE